MSRAAHQVLDRPIVLDDPIALAIVGPGDAAAIRLGGRPFDTQLARSLRAYVVARARLAEAELQAAVARGVGQFVVLGAGLDTFAYRNPYAASALRVFEVDHPSTQAWKRRRLAAAGIAVPEALCFVACDFESQDFIVQLQAAGFDRDRPAFFSWLGVSMYLAPALIMQTMASIQALAAGSGVVFDYFSPAERLNLPRRMLFGMFTAQLALAGEPLKSTLDPAALAGELTALGFTQVRDMGPEALNALYFANRTDRLAIDGLVHVMTALT